jgi:hypothetical protein
MKTKWMTLADGGSDTWLEMRRVGERAFQFIEVTDMHAVTGEEYGDRYAVEVLVVDLAAIPPEQIASAQRSCGWETEATDAAVAEMCLQHGCKALLWSASGNGRTRLQRAARSEAHRLLKADELAEAMARPVNALGSTAAEYMAGDLLSGMLRGVDAGSPAALLMAKLHGFQSAPESLNRNTVPMKAA